MEKRNIVKILILKNLIVIYKMFTNKITIQFMFRTGNILFEQDIVPIKFQRHITILNTRI